MAGIRIRRIPSRRGGSSREVFRAYSTFAVVQKLFEQSNLGTFMDNRPQEDHR